MLKRLCDDISSHLSPSSLFILPSLPSPTFIRGYLFCHHPWALCEKYYKFFACAPSSSLFFVPLMSMTSYMISHSLRPPLFFGRRALSQESYTFYLVFFNSLVFSLIAISSIVWHFLSQATLLMIHGYLLDLHF